MSNHERQTGLNSYLIRTSCGEYLYDIDTKMTGNNPTVAIAFLWTPEEAPAQITKLERRIPWAGNITALRAR